MEVHVCSQSTLVFVFEIDILQLVVSITTYDMPRKSNTIAVLRALATGRFAAYRAAALSEDNIQCAAALTIRKAL